VVAEQMPELVRRYGNKINIQYFFYPLDHKCNSNIKNKFHENACDAAMVAACDDKKFAKVNDDFTDGVGIHLSGNTLGLVVRRNSIDTVVGTYGQFSTNDIIRITFSGDDYTVNCNSQQRGTWTDRLGQVTSDAGHRSLGIRVEGASGSDGARSFSPALDHVELG
jgi:hypothetical protein